MELDRTIAAHEAVQELSRQERLDSDQGVNGKVRDLMLKLDTAEQTIDALERLDEYQRKNRIAVEKMLEAYDTIGELHRKHRIELDQFIKAHEAVGDMARRERLDAENMLKAYELLNEFAIEERKKLIEGKDG